MLQPHEAKRGAEVLFCTREDLGLMGPQGTDSKIIKVRARIVGVKTVCGAYANVGTPGANVKLEEDVVMGGHTILPQGMQLDVRLNDTHMTEDVWLEPKGGAPNDLSVREELWPDGVLLFQVSQRQSLCRAVVRKKASWDIVARGTTEPMSRAYHSRAAAIAEYNQKVREERERAARGNANLTCKHCGATKPQLQLICPKCGVASHCYA